MTLAADLLAEWDADVTAGADAVFTRFRDLARSAASTPRATGGLAAGVDFPDGIQGSPASGVLYTDLKSTARTGAGADYGTILDRSTGRLVEASDYGKKAFGPIPAASGTGFIRSFRVTTKHVGWWDESTNESLWNEAAQALDAHNL